MANRSFPLLALFFCTYGLSHAAPVTVSASGQFSSLDTALAPLVTPNGTFAFSFTIDSDPAVSNVDASGFDVPFQDFLYSLNNVAVPVAPATIRFATDSDGGLFSLYFGPESGYLNGVPVPIFDFLGSEAFTGSTATPTIETGDYAATYWAYSDSLNFDSPSVPALTVSIAPAVSGAPAASTPEPSTLFLACGSILAIAIISASAKRRAYRR